VLKFFPNGSYNINTTLKFSAYNGVLTACRYDVEGFHAHLLIALDKDAKLKNLSFSSLNGIETMYSLNFNQGMHITFNSGAVFYHITAEVSPEIINNLELSIFNLYSHPHCQADSKVGMLDPKVLLQELSQCAITHTSILKATSYSLEAITQNMPMFLKLLTSAFDQEFTRINEKHKENNISPS
jgi:hypothetical protein